MKRFLNATFILTFVIGTISLVSCTKKCDFGEDVMSGEIKQDVSVYPISGYLTESMNGKFLITGSHQYANKFQISTDKGHSKSSVNYNEYSILCHPMVVGCFTQFDRSVAIDDANGIVKYTIKVKECGKCKQERRVENYVAIRSVPSTYQLIVDVQVTNE